METNTSTQRVNFTTRPAHYHHWKLDIEGPVAWLRMKVSEDWDLGYRIARKFKIGFVAEPLLNYRNHTAAAHLNVENMERGMLMFYEKAFATDDPEILKVRRQAYANFHRVMAGSYFHSGRISKFVSHAAKSIWMQPGNLEYFLRFPMRRLAVSRGR